jgi:hypothetical protein
VQSNSPGVQRSYRVHRGFGEAGRDAEPEETGMTRLNAEEIAQYAYRAGFRGQGLTTAVAVALAESSGNTRAHNDTPPDNSYGLWQINMLGALGPERRRQYDLDSNSELFNPAVNARVANSISSDGKDWGPWSTYTNGMYKQHLDKARRAAREVTENRGKGDGGRGQGGSGNGGQGGQGGRGNGGFAVDTGMLDAFAKRTRNVADELTSVATKQVRGVREIADDSFGKIGKESGFAGALDSFGAALQRQVKGVGSNADALAASTAKTSNAYRRQDDELAQSLRPRNR